VDWERKEEELNFASSPLFVDLEPSPTNQKNFSDHLSNQSLSRCTLPSNTHEPKMSNTIRYENHRDFPSSSPIGFPKMVSVQSVTDDGGYDPESPQLTAGE